MLGNQLTILKLINSVSFQYKLYLREPNNSLIHEGMLLFIEVLQPIYKEKITIKISLFCKPEKK